MLSELYRPKDFENFFGNEDVKKILLNKVRVERMVPHILFVGKPGTGKTTMAYIIINELGVDFIEINASDERGIDTIRRRVKMYARSASTSKFKIVLLDEADYLTDEAQTSLRRLMERYENNCKFILTANYENKIIDALKSRCSVFVLNPITKKEIVSRLLYICQQENYKYKPDTILRIVDLAFGDMRKAINILESCMINNEVVEINLGEVGDIHKLMEFINARDILQIKTEIDKLLKFGDEKTIVKEIFEYYYENLQTIKPSPTIFLKLAEYEYRISQSSYPYIQLLALVIELGGN